MLVRDFIKEYVTDVAKFMSNLRHWDDKVTRDTWYDVDVLHDMNEVFD